MPDKYYRYYAERGDESVEHEHERNDDPSGEDAELRPRPDGGGLGLFIVKAAANKSMGRLSVVSRPDRGTRYRLCYNLA